ncbi:MAG: amidohydrolase family protein [Dehalococcoidia bacterium]|nr:amidohydrolase family protein [Dehalococcoidia bacterium]
MFIFDCEAHLWGPMDDINYFPTFKEYVNSLVGFQRSRFLQFAREPVDWDSEEVQKEYKATVDAIRARAYAAPQADAESLIASMNDGKVNMACVIPEIMTDLSYGHRVRSTNGYVAKAIAKYPDRLVGIANVGPVVARGVDKANWELEHLVKEKGFKACKFYPPDDVAINDKRLWPFYNKVRELGIPLFVHTGFSWVTPGFSHTCHPMLLEEVCFDFPEIPIVAIHMGYPFTTETSLLAAKFQNFYACSSLLPRFGLGYTKKAQEILGEFLAIAGPDKLIWGVDWSGSLAGHKKAVEYLMTMQISEELQRDYHYPPITQETRAKWAGLNLARIMKIEVPQSAQEPEKK